MEQDNRIHETDRTGWGSGPWDGEPDRLEWTTKAGLPGLAVRGPVGSWCGYAAVPPGHRFHGQDYNAVDVEVHGGLTYTGECQGPICHAPAPGEPDNVWWFGFDTAHLGDFVPGFNKLRRFGIKSFTESGDVYKTLDYVKREVESLAQQLVDLA